MKDTERRPQHCCKTHDHPLLDLRGIFYLIYKISHTDRAAASANSSCQNEKIVSTPGNEIIVPDLDSPRTSSEDKFHLLYRLIR